jgi:hypothetical protein
MSRKLFIIFIVLAIILSITSFSLIKQTNTIYSQSEHSIGTFVFNNIKIDDIKTVKIINPDLNTITLHKKSNSWVVKSLYDYPADTNKLSDLFHEIANLKVVQNVRTTPRAYEELNLLPPNSTKKGKAIKIQFYSDKEKLLYSLLIGKKRFATDCDSRTQIAVGRYVRLPSQKNIILTDELFNNINFKANDWLYDPNISISNIKKIELSKNSKIEWILARNTAEEDFLLKGTPKYEVLNKQRIEAITNSLNNLKVNSVADSKLSVAETGLNYPISLAVSTFERTKYELLIGKIYDHNRYVKLKIIADKKTLTKHQLNQQNLFSKWIYLIDLNRIDPLLTSKDGLLSQEKKKRAPINTYSHPIS